MKQESKITVYSKPGCGGCTATKRALNSKGYAFTEKDITKDDAALSRVKELGFLSMPVVEINEGEDSWTGFDLDKINSIS